MNDEQVKKWAALNLSLFLDKESERIEKFIGPKEINIFRRHFFFVRDSFAEAFARRLTQTVLGNVSAKNRWRAVTFLKKARSLFMHRLYHPSDCCGTKTIMAIAKKVSAAARPYRQKRAAICLTHDVDTLHDYAAISLVVDLESKRDIKSVFNFLTEGEYELKRDVLSRLADCGFEVGLHGLTHDISFAYRSEEVMEKALLKARKQIGLVNFGFRSPALALSAELLRALGKVGASYDSSVSFYYKNLGSCFPYFLPGANLWELPLSLQDDVLFRDLGMSANEAFSLVKKFAEDAKAAGGICVFNFHPFLISRHLEFYESVMEFLQQDSEILVCTGRELIGLMEERRANIRGI